MKRIAITLNHEITHNQGVIEKEINDKALHEADYTYLTNQVIRRITPKKKTTTDLMVERYSKTLKRIKWLESRIKRSERLLTKYKKKARYYEKKSTLKDSPD